MKRLKIVLLGIKQEEVKNLIGNQIVIGGENIDLDIVITPGKNAVDMSARVLAAGEKAANEVLAKAETTSAYVSKEILMATKKSTQNVLAAEIDTLTSSADIVIGNYSSSRLNTMSDLLNQMSAVKEQANDVSIALLDMKQFLRPGTSFQREQSIEKSYGANQALQSSLKNMGIERYTMLQCDLADPYTLVNAIQQHVTKFVETKAIIDSFIPVATK